MGAFGGFNRGTWRDDGKGRYRAGDEVDILRWPSPAGSFAGPVDFDPPQAGTIVGRAGRHGYVVVRKVYRSKQVQADLVASGTLNAYVAGLPSFDRQLVPAAWIRKAKR